LAHVYCGQTAGLIRIPLDTEVGLGPSDIVRWGPSYAHGKGHSSPQFSVHVCCGQNDWMDKDVTWYGGKTWPRDILLDGYSAPPARKGAHPHFSAHVYCGQMAGWIRIPLGTEVGLVPGDIVSYGDPAPHGKGHNSFMRFPPYFYFRFLPTR